jgi:SNF2 family DNA or RNA helicase
MVHALSLTPEEAVQLLCKCRGKGSLAPGVALTQDLVFLADVVRYCGGLVARQQFLPGLKWDGIVWRAVWEPVLVGPDAARVTDLAKRMPASVRCLLKVGARSTQEIPAREVLIGFIAETVEYLVRSASEWLDRNGPRVRSKTKTANSPHEAWLLALRGPEGVLGGDDSKWDNLASQIAEWRRPISTAAESPCRLCFRLEEPGENGSARRKEVTPNDATWTVRYLLQPHDDPSLLLPVEEVWKTRGRASSQLKRYGLNVREYLLSDLGQASGLCPRISHSLKASAPAGYELDTNGAHEFLTERSIALEQAGFGVMLPAWWTRKGTKIRLAARAKVKSPKLQGASGLSLDAITHFDWEVALDGKTLTLRELESLAKAKSSLVKIRGQWVEMRAEEIRSAIEFWKQKSSGQATVREILQLALGAVKTSGAIEIEGVKATGWICELLKQLEGSARFEELGSPRRFSGTLRPYQVRGYSWLAFLRRWGLGACLADDMGLGKTVQTLAQLQRDRQEGLDRPVLLVCPTTVVNNWVKEAAHFTPDLSVMVHHGIERKKGQAFLLEVQRQAIVISSYALLHRDAEFLQQVSWAGVILDEAQNIKNPETKQARAARSLACDYRVALTGTPVENNVGDLWSIMEFLNPGFLGTQAEFKRNFFIPIQTGQDPSAAQRLKRITGPFILRRLKTDKSIIADLPDKQEMKVFCPLTKEQASLYAAVLKEVEEELNDSEGIQRKGLILATLSKLKQVCNHPAQFLGDNSSVDGRSGKLTRLSEMLEEILEVGERALVFTQFAEMGAILQRHLEESFGREVLFLHGAVTKKRRDEMVERFQADEGPPIFVLSLKAGGTGLNLTQANHVFHFDRWWNPAVENQATDRAFRIGQTRNVQIHKYVCAGTLEEKIDEMIERKKEIAENVVGTGEGWLTELSNEELKDLIALRKDAVQE